MKRRDFLKQTLVGAAAGSLFGRSLIAADTPAAGSEALLQLCSQESRIPGGGSLRDKVLRLQDWGGVGLEIGGAPAQRVNEIREAIRGTKVRISALCWGSKNGDLVSTDAEKRRNGIAALKQALTVAGELEARGVIFVPCFNKQSALAPAELDKILLEVLPELGDHAQTCGTKVLLEPLNKGETFYLNRLEQAVTICKAVNHPGVAMMGDFYHMAKEETDDRAAFVQARKFLHHVHLASRTRVLPGQDDRSFVSGFAGLKHIGYRGYCSLECGVKKGTDPLVELPKAFRFLEEQWKQATA